MFLNRAFLVVALILATVSASHAQTKVEKTVAIDRTTAALHQIAQKVDRLTVEVKDDGAFSIDAFGLFNPKSETKQVFQKQQATLGNHMDAATVLAIGFLSDVRSTLGVGNGETMKPVASKAINGSLFRFRTFVGDIPMEDSDVAVSVNEAGQIDIVTGTIRTCTPAMLEALSKKKERLTPDQVKDKIRSNLSPAVQKHLDGMNGGMSEPQLWISPTTPPLVYLVGVGNAEYRVDAVTGKFTVTAHSPDFGGL